MRKAKQNKTDQKQKTKSKKKTKTNHQTPRNKNLAANLEKAAARGALTHKMKVPFLLPLLPERRRRRGGMRKDRQTERAEMCAEPLLVPKGSAERWLEEIKAQRKGDGIFFPLKLIFNGKSYWTETWTRVS